MIAKVKSVDKTVFYLQYVRYVAGELSLLINKFVEYINIRAIFANVIFLFRRMTKTQFLLLRCYKPGNIAESILLVNSCLLYVWFLR